MQLGMSEMLEKKQSEQRLLLSQIIAKTFVSSAPPRHLAPHAWLEIA
jgi:hypothetical protein